MWCWSLLAAVALREVARAADYQAYQEAPDEYAWRYCLAGCDALRSGSAYSNPVWNACCTAKKVGETIPATCTQVASSLSASSGLRCSETVMPTTTLPGNGPTTTCHDPSAGPGTCSSAAASATPCTTWVTVTSPKPCPATPTPAPPADSTPPDTPAPTPTPTPTPTPADTPSSPLGPPPDSSSPPPSPDTPSPAPPENTSSSNQAQTTPDTPTSVPPAETPVPSSSTPPAVTPPPPTVTPPAPTVTPTPPADTDDCESSTPPWSGVTVDTSTQNTLGAAAPSGWKPGERKRSACPVAPTSSSAQAQITPPTVTPTATLSTDCWQGVDVNSDTHTNGAARPSDWTPGEKRKRMTSPQPSCAVTSTTPASPLPDTSSSAEVQWTGVSAQTTQTAGAAMPSGWTPGGKRKRSAPDAQITAPPQPRAAGEELMANPGTNTCVTATTTVYTDECYPGPGSSNPGGDTGGGSSPPGSVSTVTVTVTAPPGSECACAPSTTASSEAATTSTPWQGVTVDTSNTGTQGAARPSDWVPRR